MFNIKEFIQQCVRVWHVLTKPTAKEYLYKSMCDKLIMVYRKPGEVRIDDGLQVDSKDMVGEDD